MNSSSRCDSPPPPIPYSQFFFFFFFFSFFLFLFLLFSSSQINQIDRRTGRQAGRACEAKQSKAKSTSSSKCVSQPSLSIETIEDASCPRITLSSRCQTGVPGYTAFAPLRPPACILLLHSWVVHSNLPAVLVRSSS